MRKMNRSWGGGGGGEAVVGVVVSSCHSQVPSPTTTWVLHSWSTLAPLLPCDGLSQDCCLPPPPPQKVGVFDDGEGKKRKKAETRPFMFSLASTRFLLLKTATELCI